MKSIFSKAKNGLAALRSGLSVLRSTLRKIGSKLLAAFPWSDQSPRRVKTPTVLQMEAAECGAAALGKVLEYHGRVVPLEELREACGVSRDGSKASNMMKAARSYGLTAKGYKKQPSSLKEMKGPMIVHWNFNHFVVLEGFRNGKVYINDPATGPRVVTEEEFDDAFTGVVLTFEPGPDFEEVGSRRSLLKALGDRLKGSEQAVLYVVLAGLALVVPGLIVPTFSQIFVDDILVGGAHNWIRPLLLAMGIASVALIGLTWLQENYLMRLETKLASSTSGKFFWHVLRLPFRFFTQRQSGEIGSRVGLNDKVARMLSGRLATTMLSVIMIVFYAALMIQYDLVLTIIGVTIAGLNIVVMRYISRKRKDANRRLLQERGKMKGTAMGGLQTIETLKATGSEADFFTRWAGHHAKTINAQQQLGRYSQALTIAPSFLMQIGTASILGVGAFRVMDGQMSMGMLVAFQALMGSFISPVNDLVSMAGRYQEAEGDMDRLDDVLRYEADRDPELDSEVEELSLRTAVGSGGDPAEEREGTSLSAKLEGRLELRDVTFGYNNLEDPFIDGLNLEITPGSRVALVGGSGSGKSTVGKLVCGLCEPWSGEIRFDGISREEVPPSILNNSFSFVDQDIFLFRGSVMENLTLWDETVPEADVIEAARDATIHEAISQRPHGYHSEVKESGRNFSGGQQQRLEIARALSGRPSVMVLDEATSALDVATEKAIDDNIRRRGCTCLIIAHRLSTIRDCDEIIVLDDGTVVERGTHDNLMEQNGPYASLIEKY